MSAVGFHLTTTLDTLVLHSNPEATHTPTNPQQAQGAPVPQDIVTLTPQSARGRHNNPPNQLNFAPKALLAALRRNVQDPEAPATAQDIEQTQQEELQQLDQSLQQLGIDPQSISLFNQLALLTFANDPAALQQFVRQLQQSAQQLLDQGVLASAAANQSQRDVQPLTIPAQIIAVGQEPVAVATALAQSAESGAPASAIPAPAQAGPNAPETASQGNALSATFQELQITVAVLEGQPPPAPSSLSRPAALNVTA